MANPGPSSTTTIHPSNLASNQAIRLLGVAIGVNVNATGDQAVIAISNSTNYSSFHLAAPVGSSAERACKCCTQRVRLCMVNEKWLSSRDSCS